MYLVTAARGHLHDSALSATKQGGRDEFSLLKSSRIGVGHAGVAMRHVLSNKLPRFGDQVAGDTFVVFFDLTKCWTALYAKTWSKLSLSFDVLRANFLLRWARCGPFGPLVERGGAMR